MPDLDISRCAALLNLHIVYGRRSGDQQEFRAAQAPVGLCTWGCPPPTSPWHTLLGKTHQVIHLLTGAEKQVQLGTVISPMLAGTVPAAAPSVPSSGVIHPS